MELLFVQGKKPELREVLDWLREEHASTGEGFYCNRNVIAKSFTDGSAICAISKGQVVAFSVYYVSPPCSGISIIEVHPRFRRQGIGALVMAHTIQFLKDRGAEYIDAECTSPEGEALCRAHDFQTYIDPRNYRSEYAPPELRLTLKPQLPSKFPFS
jgi:GNAT superfamily N-acetyltransferase